MISYTSSHQLKSKQGKMRLNFFLCVMSLDLYRSFLFSMSEENSTIYTTQKLRQTIQEEATVYYFQFSETEQLYEVC